MLPINNNTRTICVAFENAYHDLAVSIMDLEFRFLPAEGKLSTYPEGQVGFISAGSEQVPELLRNLIEHYLHYKRTAEKFSETWNRDHAPSRTVEILEKEGRNRRHNGKKLLGESFRIDTR